MQDRPGAIRIGRAATSRAFFRWSFSRQTGLTGGSGRWQARGARWLALLLRRPLETPPRPTPHVKLQTDMGGGGHTVHRVASVTRDEAPGEKSDVDTLY